MTISEESKNKTAELGDLIQLGEYYRDGKQGFKQDGATALQCFLKAADKNPAKSFEIIAEMYREGKSVKADGFKAIEYYEKLDALDDKQAALNIAEIYTEGCGKLKGNGYKAIEIYDEIIQHGRYWAKVGRRFGLRSSQLENYKRALRAAAEIYLEGKSGVRPDGNLAIEYLSELAENDDMNAIREIAEIYLEGKAGIAPDGHTAIKFFNKIIERGDYDEIYPTPNSAMQAIAEIFRDGKGGVEPNGYTAIDYFERLAQDEHKKGLGNDKAWILKEIAEIYRDGKGGVTQDGAKAVEYFSKIIEIDDSDSDDDEFDFSGKRNALYELGQIYEHGCGEIVIDIDKAIEFYRKANANDKHFFAKISLEKLTGETND